MTNILVTGSGGGVGQSIIKALKHSDLDPTIIATDTHPLAAGIYRTNKGYIVPKATSKEYVNRISEICLKEKIDIVFVGSDPELPVLAKNKVRIERETGSLVVVSNQKTVSIGNDKWKTYLFLRKNGFFYPLSSLPDDIERFLALVPYPVIIKPRTGSASRDVYIANNKTELEIFINRVKDPVIQEYLRPDNEEYTSGVVSFDGEIFGVITLKREIKGGNTYRAVIDDFDPVREEAARICSVLRPFGPSNLQMRLTEKGPTVFEINPRLSGTTAIRAVSGFNEPEFIINYLLFDRVLPLTFKKCIVSRYMNEVYVPCSEYRTVLESDRIFNSQSRIMDYF